VGWPGHGRAAGLGGRVLRASRGGKRSPSRPRDPTREVASAQQGAPRPGRDASQGTRRPRILRDPCDARSWARSRRAVDGGVRGGGERIRGAVGTTEADRTRPTVDHDLEDPRSGLGVLTSSTYERTRPKSCSLGMTPASVSALALIRTMTRMVGSPWVGGNGWSSRCCVGRVAFIVLVSLSCRHRDVE